jgi:hypothetical protein
MVHQIGKTIWENDFAVFLHFSKRLADQFDDTKGARGEGPNQLIRYTGDQDQPGQPDGRQACPNSPLCSLDALSLSPFCLISSWFAVFSCPQDIPWGGFLSWLLFWLQCSLAFLGVLVDSFKPRASGEGERTDVDGCHPGVAAPYTQKRQQNPPRPPIFDEENPPIEKKPKKVIAFLFSPRCVLAFWVRFSLPPSG